MVTNAFSLNILNEVDPIKLNETRCLKLNSCAWGFLSDYYVESVKVNNYNGKTSSAATIKVGDKSGQVTCVVKGSLIGLLFGLTKSQWTEVEELSLRSGSLFYRHFKDGLNQNFTIEQKLFYYFCHTNQRKDVFLVVFKRNVNTRTVNKSDAFLLLLDIIECTDKAMDLYINYLRTTTGLNGLPKQIQGCKHDL